MAIERMTGEGFGRSLAVQARQFAWFLGAGSSASANIPTGYDMILDFKARLFCGAVGVPRREIDPTDPMWRERMEAQFDGANGLPPSGHPEEYAAAFEAVFPSEAERRSYIEGVVRQGSPSFGHRVLAALITSGQASCLFTTNFDSLIERAATVADELLPVDHRVHLTVAALDSVERADRCLHESSWPLLVKLHGDYQSVQLKNTTAELQSQDAALRRVLVGACNRFGLIVLGYSGRDASVMDALHETLEGPSPFPSGIRWVVRGGSAPLSAVSTFLEAAHEAGVDARFVGSETFDEFAADIDRQVALPDELALHVRQARAAPVVQPMALPTLERSPFPVLRCSALPVLSLPTVARRLRLAQPITTVEARAALKAMGTRAVVVARGHEIAAFGVDDELLEAFKSYGPRIDGDVALSPSSDSWALGLLYDALVRALTRGRPLRPILRGRGHSVAVASTNPARGAEEAQRDRKKLDPLRQAYREALVGTVPGAGLPFAEAIRIRLECHDQRWWCVFDPFTWVDFPRVDRQPGQHRGWGAPPGRRGHADPTGDWRRERWARRYNPKWSAILDAWAGLLVSGREDTVHAIGLRDRPGVDARFQILGTTAWSRPTRLPMSGV